MDEQTFRSYMGRAQIIGGEYATGYQRGLRRHYHGERFGTDAEHEQWMALGVGDDNRLDRGRGYRDGFAGREPKL